MIVRHFLTWTKTAPAAARADGASALARAYLDGELDPEDSRDAEAAMTALLDDPSPLVRAALAREIGPAATAPRHLVTAILDDRSDIAALVLEASPLLDEDDLVDAVAVGDATAQAAVARRPYLASGVAGAIAEVAALPACVTLCLSATATVAPVSLRRMLERFGDDPFLREVLGRRPDVDAGLRHDLAVATAGALAGFVTRCGWLPVERASRITREAADQAAVALAAEAVRESGAAGILRLAAHLRDAGRLTPALLLRALLSGHVPLFEGAVSILSGIPYARVAGLSRGASGVGFAALYARAKLPSGLLPLFEAAARDACRAEDEDGARPHLRRSAVTKLLGLCAAGGAIDLGKAVALLRGLEAEAAREEARSFAVGLAPTTPLLPLPHAAAPPDVVLLSAA